MDPHDEAARRQAFVCHELRTPLAVMRPALDMLLDGTAGELSEKQLDYLHMLDRNVQRLAAMITSVVESGWLESAAVPATVATVAVRELVEQSVADVCRSLVEHPRVKTDLADDLPPLRGDPQRLRRALRNVLLNACAYTPPAGRVSVTANLCAGDDRILIAVVDTGCGVEPAELQSVLDFGFQGAAGRVRDARGLGLGLFVTAEVVKSHGGRIWLESTPGEGTRVSLELPVAPFTVQATDLHVRSVDSGDYG